MLRFACPNCQQKLSVGVHKAGTSAKCPRCQQQFVVPKPGPDTPHISSAAALPPPPPPGGNKPPGTFEQYLVYDDDTEIVYDADTPAPPAVQPADSVSVPRWVLYAQGGMLAVIAIFSFAMGVLAGGNGGGGNNTTEDPNRSYKLYGEISFLLADRKTNDDGAVIIALPQNEYPDEKIPGTELLPQDVAAEPAGRAKEIIRVLGGGYARTNKDGYYEMNLPKKGTYFVLVVAGYNKRKPGQNVSVKEAGEMGRFIEGPIDMIGTRPYVWKKENIRNDLRLPVFFE